MHLTDSDKKILDGHCGEPAQKAMELMVRYGRVIGAEKLCAVTWADLFCGFHDYLGVSKTRDFDSVFSQMALCTSEKTVLKSMAKGCICFSGVEPDCSEVPDQMFMDENQKETNQTFLDRFAKAGVILSGNCIPYLTGFVPIMGEHFVSCESSAVLFMNTLWGAMGNGDGIEASFCAAVCGRTPEAGMHVRENRKGTIEVLVQKRPETLHDWDMLGYTAGKKLPVHAVPVFTGALGRPNAISLKTFFASLACAAGTEMCHLVGISPEAPTPEMAFQGIPPADTVPVTARDMAEARDSLTSKRHRPVDYVSVGCPHLHVEELRHIARFLDGKKIHANTILDIWTTGPMLYMADRCGYSDRIRQSGARLLTGGCPSNRGYPKGTRTVALDASKQRQDTPAGMDVDNIFLGSRIDCLRSAVKGKWTGNVR